MNNTETLKNFREKNDKAVEILGNLQEKGGSGCRFRRGMAAGRGSGNRGFQRDDLINSFRI